MKKTCTKCNVEFPATNDNFYKAKKGKYGLTAICKKCQRDYKREYSKRNKDKLAKYNKNYYEQNRERCLDVRKAYRDNNPEFFSKWRKNNKEYIREYNAAYYEENKKEVNNYKSNWYERNSERIIKKNVMYKHNNREKVRLWENKRRSLKVKLPSSLTHNQWEKIISDFDNSCAYCGKKEKLTQEHFIPLSKGGEFTHNNIIPSCASCNSSKQAKDFFEWYPHYKYYDKRREKFVLEYLNYNKDKRQQLSIL